MSRSCFAAYSGSKLAAQDQSGEVQSTTVRELAARGFDDARPSHDHAVRAIALGADSASRLSRALSVWSRRPRRPAPSWSSGYVVTEDDPADGRRKRIRMTDLGHEVMPVGGHIFDELRNAWTQQRDYKRLTRLEEQRATADGA